MVANITKSDFQNVGVGYVVAVDEVVEQVKGTHQRPYTDVTNCRPQVGLRRNPTPTTANTSAESNINFDRRF